MEIGRLESTVESLLLLARDVPADRRALDVAQLLTDSEAAWRARLGAGTRRLELLVLTTLPSVAASESAVRQILDVLVENATVHGGGTVRVSARGLAGGLAIEVGDEGPGIKGDPEIAFSRRRSGSGRTGIGLALARSLAEAEGARLVLVSPGPRPVFRLVFAMR